MSSVRGQDVGVFEVLTSETKSASQIATHKLLSGTASGSCLFLPLLLFLEFLLREVG